MARSGNGIDLVAVYRLLSEVAETVRSHSGRLDRLDGRLDTQDAKLNEVIGTVNDHSRRFEDVAAVMNRQERKLDDLVAGISDLRKALTDYHGSIVGHGVFLTELDQRVERIERRLDLDPLSL